MSLKLFSTVLLLMFYTGSAIAAGLFQLTVNGQTRSYGSVDELPDFNTMKQQFGEEGINWETGRVEVTLNYRGIDITALYTGSTDFTESTEGETVDRLEFEISAHGFILKGLVKRNGRN